MMLRALGVHIFIQTLEGYVLAPLIQRRAVDPPPVLTLPSVMLFATLLGPGCRARDAAGGAD